MKKSIPIFFILVSLLLFILLYKVDSQVSSPNPKTVSPYGKAFDSLITIQREGYPTLNPTVTFDGANYHYLTTFGEYVWLQPLYYLRYIHRNGTILIDKSVFVLQENSTGTWLALLTYANVISSIHNNTYYKVEYDITKKVKGTTYTVGHVVINMEFYEVSEPKISVSFTKYSAWNTINLGSFRWIWDIVPYWTYYMDEESKTCTQLSGMSGTINKGSKQRVRVTSVNNFNALRWIRLDWVDFGNATVLVGDEPFWNSDGIVVVFPPNVATIDPSTIYDGANGLATRYETQRKVFRNPRSTSPHYFDGDSYYDSAQSIYSGSYTRVAQTFIPQTNKILSKSVFALFTSGSPTGYAYSKLYATSGGAPTSVLTTSAGVDVTTILTTWTEFTFSSYSLSAGVTYAISIEYEGGDATNYLNVRTDSTNRNIGQGYRYLSSWTTTNDIAFKIESSTSANLYFSLNEEYDGVVYHLELFRSSEGYSWDFVSTTPVKNIVTWGSASLTIYNDITNNQLVIFMVYSDTTDTFYRRANLTDTSSDPTFGTEQTALEGGVSLKYIRPVIELANDGYLWLVYSKSVKSAGKWYQDVCLVASTATYPVTPTWSTEQTVYDSGTTLEATDWQYATVVPLSATQDVLVIYSAGGATTSLYAIEYSWNGSTFSTGTSGSFTVAYSDRAHISAVVDSSNKVHILYGSSTNVNHVPWTVGTGFGSSGSVYATAPASLALSIDITASTDKLYAFYIRQSNIVNYKTSLVDSINWSSEQSITDGLSESLDYLSSSYKDWYANSKLQVIYTTQTTFVVRFVEVGNVAPTNDALDTTATFTINGDFGWANVTVTDINQVADLQRVDIKIETVGDAETFAFRWTQSSNTFEELNDTSGIATLSGSVRVNIDADTDKIAFRFKFTGGTTGNCDVKVESKDDDNAIDYDTYLNKFVLQAGAQFYPRTASQILNMPQSLSTFKSLVRSSGQPLSFSTVAESKKIFPRVASQVFNMLTETVTSKIMPRNVPQTLQLLTQSSRVYNVFRISSQNLQFSFDINRILSGFRTTSQVLFMQTEVSSAKMFPRTVNQVLPFATDITRLFTGSRIVNINLQLFSSESRIYYGYRTINQQFNLISSVTRQGLFDRIISQPLQFALEPMRSADYQRVSQLNLNFLTSTLKSQTLTRTINQQIVLESLSSRLSTLFRTIGQPMALNIDATRYSSLIRQSSQTLNLNTYISRVLYVFRTSPQNLQFLTVATSQVIPPGGQFYPRTANQILSFVTSSIRNTIGYRTVNQLFQLTTQISRSSLFPRFSYQNVLLSTEATKTFQGYRTVNQMMNIQSSTVKAFLGIRNVNQVLSFVSETSSVRIVKRTLYQNVAIQIDVSRSFTGERIINQILNIGQQVGRTSVLYRNIQQEISINNVVIRRAVRLRQVNQRISLTTIVSSLYIPRGPMLITRTVDQILTLKGTTSTVAPSAQTGPIQRFITPEIEGYLFPPNVYYDLLGVFNGYVGVETKVNIQNKVNYPLNTTLTYYVKDIGNGNTTVLNYNYTFTLDSNEDRLLQYNFNLPLVNGFFDLFRFDKTYNLYVNAEYYNVNENLPMKETTELMYPITIPSLVYVIRLLIIVFLISLILMVTIYYITGRGRGK